MVSSAAVVVLLLLVSTTTTVVHAGILYYDSNNSPAIGIFCPDGKIPCTGGTCCHLPSGGYGCCVLENAVCCSDGIHCCPSGYTCDVPDGTCLKSGVMVSWKNASSSTTKKSKPDNKELVNNLKFFYYAVVTKEKALKKVPKCLANDTVCPLENGDLGCCGHPNAVCCDASEGGLCCPNGHTCNTESKKCELSATKVAKSVVPSATKVAKTVVPSPKRVVDTICPDAQTACTTNTTCCRLVDGEYGCCPIPDAVCCTDHMHCCPKNSICDISSQTCILQNDYKPFSIIRGNAAVVVGSGRFRMMSEVKRGHLAAPAAVAAAAATAAAAALPVVKDTLCPDNSTCSENDTCCAMNTGVWGCCSYHDAVCCADYKHCCPRTFICDLTEEKCVRKHVAYALSSLRTAKKAAAASTTS